MHVKYASRHVLYSLPKFDVVSMPFKSNVAAREVTDFCFVGCVNNPDRVDVMVRVGFAVRDFMFCVATDARGVVFVVARDFMFCVGVFFCRTDIVARAAALVAIFPRIVGDVLLGIERSAAYDAPDAVKPSKNKNRNPFFLIR